MEVDRKLARTVYSRIRNLRQMSDGEKIIEIQTGKLIAKQMLDAGERLYAKSGETPVVIQ